MTQEERNRISGIVLDASIEVHKNLGPGLLESIYESCLCDELSNRGLRRERQVLLPIYYKGKRLDETFKIDVLVEDEILVELKSVEKILPIHEAQLFDISSIGSEAIRFTHKFQCSKTERRIQKAYQWL